MENKSISRRDFIRVVGAAATAALLPAGGTAAASALSAASSAGRAGRDRRRLWKGFNLLNKFNPDFQTPFSEEDFEIMAGWGFNFARIPLSYWCWSSEDDWYRVDEKCLKEIDRAVELGRQYRIHVNLNFHRVPGYCINPPHGRSDLFEDDAALDACAYHWRLFAERYIKVPPPVAP